MKGSVWKQNEIDYLETWWGKRSRSAIAKHLNRSVRACKSKAERLGIGSFRENVDGLNISAMQEIIGVTSDNIRKTWVENNGLKVSRVGMFTIVKWDDLAEFMETHQWLWDARKCDYYYFYKYPWFLEKLKRERDAGTSEMKIHKWTYLEEQQVILMRKRGFSYGKIAKELNRSESSISRRCLELGVGGYARRKSI